MLAKWCETAHIHIQTAKCANDYKAVTLLLPSRLHSRLYCISAVDVLGMQLRQHNSILTEAAWLTWWLCKNPEQAAELCHSPDPAPCHASGSKHSWDCWASAPMLACMTHVTGKELQSCTERAWQTTGEVSKVCINPASMKI